MNRRHNEEARIVAKILGKDPDKTDDFGSIVEVFNGRVA
jgi:K+/H+ antiporter YhaU regulatory subunit KhtT